MAGGLLAGVSLTQTQLIVLVTVAAIFTLLLTANVGLCWVYRRLLTEDQRHTRRAHKKKMSDVWVYQVTRPAQSPQPPPPPPALQPEDPPSQQILRKLRRSYDNLRSAAEAGEGLSREESQAIEELEVTADLFLHDTPPRRDTHSRRSSFSIYDNNNDEEYEAHHAGPFLVDDHDIDVNAFTASDTVVDASLTDPAERSVPSSRQHSRGGILAHDRRSPGIVHGGDPGSPTSVFSDDDSVFYHDHDLPNNAHHHKTHLSLLRQTEDSATKNAPPPNHTEVQTPPNPMSAALPDIDLDTLNGNVHVSSVTLEDFENYPAGTGTGRKARGGRKGKKGAKRRGSTYDNVAASTPSFPVAEFHNQAFRFAAGETAAVEVANDLEL